MLLVFGGGRSARCQFRTPEDQHFHNSTFVGVEEESARAVLFRAEERLRRGGEEREAGKELLELLRTSPTGTASFGERLVVRLPNLIARELDSLSPDLRAELASADREAVQRLLSRYRLDHDPALLEEIVDRYPLSEDGERVSLQLASRAAEEGRFSHAIGRFRSLLEAPGVSERTKDSARRGLAWLRERRRPGEFGEILDGTPDRSVHPEHGSAAPVFAWHAEVAADPTVSAEDASHRDRFPFRASTDDVLATGLPVMDARHVVTLEDDGVHVRRTADGSLAFPVVRWDFDLHLDPARFELVRDQCAATLVDDALYLNVQAVDLDHYPSAPIGALYRLDLRREGFVAAGRLGWEEFAEETQAQTGDELEEAIRARTGWSYAGPPLVLDGVLHVPAMRLLDKDTECWLRSFDAETLEPRGELFLARASAVARYSDRFSQDTTTGLVRASPLSARDGILYLCTNLGITSAVRGADLSLEWSFRYNRILPVDSRSYVRETFFVTGGWPSRAPVVFEDRLLFAPADSRYLYTVALWPNEHGDLRLEDPVEKETRLAWLGADRERLFFLVRAVVGVEQTQVRIEATDHSGGILWESPALSVRETLAGLPAQSSRYLYLPTDRQIYRVDLDREGSFDAALPPPESVRTPTYPAFGAFGDLVVTPTHLYSFSSRHLVCFQTPR